MPTLPLTTYTAAYFERGEGLSLLFLHGFLGNGLAWESTIARLSSSFRCIALDLLGFGNSSKPNLKYEISHQVAFLQEFIAAQNLNDFYLIGHSYGGWTAAAYAIARADAKLRGIALIAPAGIRDDRFVGRYAHLRPLLWETPLVDVALGAIAPVADLLGKQKAFDVIRTARRELRQQPVAKSFLCDRLRPEDAIDTVERDLHRITVPCLAIAGAKDDTIPLWHCQTYADRIPDARLMVLEDADHGLLQTHTDAIATAIAQFCSS